MIFVDQVDTRRPVQASVAETVVDVVLTMTSVKAFQAVTSVVARRVLAVDRVAAKFWHQTLVDICVYVCVHHIFLKRQSLL